MGDVDIGDHHRVISAGLSNVAQLKCYNNTSWVINNLFLSPRVLLIKYISQWVRDRIYMWGK